MQPRVVIAHDYVTQRGGAERVTLDLLRAFPGSRLVTSVWDPKSSFPEFAEHEIETLWLDKYSTLRKDPRRAFPLLARAFARHTVTDADVVICSSSGWSHRVGTTGMKVVYCHNPARWLYQPDDYFGHLPSWAQRSLHAATNSLRASDAKAAATADRYLVNSTVVAGRARAIYDLEPTVLPPAHGLSETGEREPVPGLEPGFLLTVGRARGYKHTDVVCRAVASMPHERLVVVGGGLLDDDLPDRVIGLNDVSDAQMRWLYSNAAGMVAVAHEDFGLTAIEAQQFGIPSVLLRRGGYLDSGVEDITCIYVDAATPEAVVDGIHRLKSRTWDRDVLRVQGDRYSRSVFAARMHQVVRDLTAPEKVMSEQSTATRPATRLSSLPPTIAKCVPVGGKGSLIA